jgi:hypothetical protein
MPMNRSEYEAYEASCREQVDANQSAIAEFTSKEPFEIAEPRAWGLVAVGSRCLGARGIYREIANDS